MEGVVLSVSNKYKDISSDLLHIPVSYVIHREAQAGGRIGGKGKAGPGEGGGATEEEERSDERRRRRTPCV